MSYCFIKIQIKNQNKSKGLYKMNTKFENFIMWDFIHLFNNNKSFHTQKNQALGNIQYVYVFYII